MWELVFWLSMWGVFYPYVGYPLALGLLGRLFRANAPSKNDRRLPSVSLIIPVHNEETRIGRKLANTFALSYPADRMQILFVSDGSKDRTVDIIRAHSADNVNVTELPERQGKAAALNAGLEKAVNDILVFTDVSIDLEPDAIEALTRPFVNRAIGIVSGEDRIADGGGEGLYGRYELFLRRQESQVHSIAGASGSFYAQRRVLCQPFATGMAPDFLSVLRTVEQGFRAVSEPSAVGSMTSVKDPGEEFERKVRTLIRGMTTLFAHGHLLNPFRYGLFSFVLVSHKILRWTVPFCLASAFVASLALLDAPMYLTFFLGQLVFYVLGLAAFAGWAGAQRSLPGKVALYFTLVNAAILAAWFRYAVGVRQELWTPSNR